MLIAIKIIPMPPNHCSMERHNKMPFDVLFKPVITVAPVVVSPEIASKKASVIVSEFVERSIKGRADNAPSTNQLSVVRINASRCSSTSFLFCLEARTRERPIKNVMIAD